MLESITTSGITPFNLAVCSGVSIALGLLVALVHSRTTRYTRNFATTLVVLPLLVQAVMMMVNGNLGTGVAILGAFSLVRFRSIPGTSREIVSVFFAMSLGLATGTGYVGFAVLAAGLISLVLLGLHVTNAFEAKVSQQMLKVTVSDDTEFGEVFAQVFAKHAVQAAIQMVKTKSMGSLYEITYAVTLPAVLSRKVLLDDIRVLNGNLPVTLYEANYEGGL